ncbi:hypothetical protein RND81_07G140800 [Saponaria officinalis]|uniref:Uncharacterized protein n=1 Tax=Saponaria officinalis TaxID=3572 RepID=A0AAW1JQJ1_SAPOF
MGRSISTNSSLKFKVTRHEPELIRPAKPTPNESLQLSDLDSVNSLRAQHSFIQFYENRDNIEPYLSSLGPSKVIRDAIAKALVSYYPLAGRIRETSEGKLVVECTGEELVYDGPGSSGIVHCPLLFIQGPTEISKLQHSMSQSHEGATSFELITAHLWRSRTIALYKDPHELAQLRYVVDIRSKVNPPLPTGYYGNAIILHKTEATIGNLSNKPFQYALEMVKGIKNDVVITHDYVTTLVDRVVVNRTFDGGFLKLDALIVSDLRRLGFNWFDFGWGLSVYGI